MSSGPTQPNASNASLNAPLLQPEQSSETKTPRGLAALMAKLTNALPKSAVPTAAKLEPEVDFTPLKQANETIELKAWSSETIPGNPYKNTNIKTTTATVWQDIKNLLSKDWQRQSFVLQAMNRILPPMLEKHLEGAQAYYVEKRSAPSWLNKETKIILRIKVQDNQEKCLIVSLKEELGVYYAGFYSSNGDPLLPSSEIKITNGLILELDNSFASRDIAKLTAGEFDEHWNLKSGTKYDRAIYPSNNYKCSRTLTGQFSIETGKPAYLHEGTAITKFYTTTQKPQKNNASTWSSDEEEEGEEDEYLLILVGTLTESGKFVPVSPGATCAWGNAALNHSHANSSGTTQVEAKQTFQFAQEYAETNNKLPTATIEGPFFPHQEYPFPITADLLKTLNPPHPKMGAGL